MRTPILPRTGSPNRPFSGSDGTGLLLVSGDPSQELAGREDVAIERELLALEVAAAAMAAPHPTDAAFGQRLVGGVVDALPLEMHELAPEHDDGPAHRHPGLGNERPPVLL